METSIDEESDNKMGATFRHIVHIDYHCPSCDTESQTDIEFIEYPIGCGACVNVDGDLITDKTDAALLPLVDFSFQFSNQIIVFVEFSPIMGSSEDEFRGGIR